MKSLDSGYPKSRVLVYRLYEPDELDHRSFTLERLLVAGGPGRPIRAQFQAMPAGCFRYFDRGRMGRNERGDLLPRDEAAARRVAFEYMRGVNEAAARHRSARALDVGRHPDPFPLAALRPGRAWRVRSPEAGTDDHWMTSWTVWLPVSMLPRSRQVPVIGATVEVRVGARGQVVGVVSRARPWHAVMSRPAFAWGADDPHGGHDRPELVYIADNPHEPQRFWSPCFAVASHGENGGHAHRQLWPACDHTVMPELVVQHHEGEATVRALVLTAGRKTRLVEHGRDWVVRWSTATLEQFAAGERRLVEASAAPLPDTGLFHVELTVEHTLTGAIRSTYAQVPVPMAVQDRPLEGPRTGRNLPLA
jgi:hypothetical protein